MYQIFVTTQYGEITSTSKGAIFSTHVQAWEFLKQQAANFKTLGYGSTELDDANYKVTFIQRFPGAMACSLHAWIEGVDE